MPISKLKAGSISSGTLEDARIPSLSTSKITSGTFADARLAASNVTQHVTAFDDDKIVNDISTLALREATTANRAASNTNSQYVDVFQDSTGVATFNTCSRNASEYVDSNSQTNDPNTKCLFTTTIDSHGDAIGGSPGTPIIDSTGTLQLQSTNTDCQTFSSGNAAPPSGFGTRSIRTADWDNSSNNRGYYIREVSGQTSDLNFGTGAYTIEMWVKQVDTNYNDNQHHYIYDLAKTVFKNIKIKPNIYYVPTPKRIRDGYQYYTKAKMNNLRKAGYKKDFLSIEQGVKDYIKNYLLK